MSRPAIPQTLTRRIAKAFRAELPHFGKIVEKEGEALESLAERLLEDLPDYHRRSVLNMDEQVEAGERIKAALPEDLQHTFWRLNEARQHQSFALQHAAFLIGAEIGKQLATKRMEIVLEGFSVHPLPAVGRERAAGARR